jgi:hypothetical protein
MASSGLEWVAIVYLWAADIGVDVRDASADVDFSDVVDKLEMAFQGRVEAQGDDFGGFVDVSYMSVGDNSSNSLANFNADVDMTALDLAFVWSPGPERMTGFEAFGGLRYVDTDVSLVVDPVPPVLPTVEADVDSSITDVLVGARYLMPLNEHWRLTFTGDLSAGDSEGTFSLGAFAGYRTGRHHFIAGYRHFELEIESKDRDQRVTEAFSGPLVAYGFGF